MGRPFEAIIFDLDGLMLNTEVVFHLTGTEVLRRRDKPAPPELFAAMMGHRAKEAYGIMIDMMQLTDSVEDLHTESRKVFYDLLDQHLMPMPGLMGLLDAVEDAGFNKAVATSSDRLYAEDLLGRYGLLSRFGAILTGDDVLHSKPHPEIYQRAMDGIGALPEKTLVLEDSNAGVRSAKAAGCFAVAVPHSHTHGQTYEQADLIINTLADPILLETLAISPR